jgi:membrane protein YdbS with pleckstrin-like domain
MIPDDEFREDDVTEAVAPVVLLLPVAVDVVRPKCTARPPPPAPAPAAPVVFVVFLRVGVVVEVKHGEVQLASRDDDVKLVKVMSRVGDMGVAAAAVEGGGCD